MFYSTGDGSASAAAGDYQAVVNGSVIIPANQTTQTISVAIIGDALYEADETFTLNLTSADGAALSRRSAIATIRNDDSPPVVSIGDASLVADGAGTHAEFVVTLSEASGLPAKVKFSTANGTARARTDYKSVSGVLQFAPGQTQKVVSVPVLGDLQWKIGMDFFVKLSSPTKAKIGEASKGMCMIQPVGSSDSASLLQALVVARKPAARSDAMRVGPVVDEAIRLLMLSGK